jgi:hypothetical protein
VTSRTATTAPAGMAKARLTFAASTITLLTR